MFKHFLLLFIIFLNTFVIMYSWREWGGLYNSSGIGGSVAKASEANVSIIKLI